MNNKNLIAIVAIITALAGLLYWALNRDEVGPKGHTDGANDVLVAWPETDGNTAKLSSNGTQVLLTSFEKTIELSPKFPDLTILETRQDGLTWEADIELYGAKGLMKWRTAPGNPQAIFELEITDVPRKELISPFAGTIELERGDITYVDATLNPAPFVGETVGIENHTPGWLQWQGPATVTFSQWWADRMEISNHADGQRLTFLVWHPDVHPDITTCDGAPSVDLKFRLVVTLASPPPVHLHRFRGGTEAALVPVFTNPSGEGGARDAADFAARVRTLSFGHSNPEDPRHGNGGLVGGKHGGTFLVPGLWKDELSALKESIEATDVEFAWTGDPAEIVRAEDPCTLMESRIWVQQGPLYPGTFANSLTSDTPIGPAMVSPVLLNTYVAQSRATLYDQTLSKLYIDRLVRERGSVLIETPLVATRNPLIDAADQALLAPERNGEWTIDPTIESMFAGLDLLREDTPFKLMSVSTWLREISDHRQHLVLLSPEGQWTIQPANPELRLVNEATFTTNPISWIWAP